MKTLVPRRARVAPWEDLFSLRDPINRIFGQGFPVMPQEAMPLTPEVDLIEREGEYLLTAELPGMRSEDVEVDIEEDVLTIKGEKLEREEEKRDGKTLLVERRFGSFERSFTLPRSVVAEKIEAEFEEGVLKVHLPKRPESKARKIPIHGS